ncbi:MAG: hypothetical protein ACOCZH_00445 [Phototrophicaceae bacterium]
MNAPPAPRQPQRPLLWPDFIDELQAAAEGTPAYIVGGAVRDAFFQRPVHDIDLTTPHDAIGLARRLANRLRGDFFIMDRERDVARVLLDQPPQPFAAPDAQAQRLVIDVARFRGDDLLADLTDRDFTINALAVDLHSDLTHIIDPLNGERDLIERVLRACTPQAIHDDPIRALRAVRQSVQFKARIEAATRDAIRDAGPQLARISPERVRDEFFNLLSGPSPVAALRVADSLGLLAPIVPELAALRDLPQPRPHTLDAWRHTLLTVEKLHSLLHVISPARTDTSAATFDMGMVVMTIDRFRKPLQQHIAQQWPNERPHHALLLLGALLQASGKPSVAQTIDGQPQYPGHEAASAQLAEERAIALRLSNGEKQRLALMIANHSLLQADSQWTDLDLHRFWRRLGVAGVDACLLALAVHLGTVGIEINQDTWIALLERAVSLLDAWYNRYDTVVAPPPLVDGRVLKTELDLKSGPLIGELLDFIRESQVVGRIATTEEALAAARQLLEGRAG